MTDLPTMVPVSSSNIHSIGHNGRDMFVRFKDKTGAPTSTYRHAGVPADIYEHVKTHKSPGHAYIDRVKHFYPGEKL